MRAKWFCFELENENERSDKIKVDTGSLEKRESEGRIMRRGDSWHRERRVKLEASGLRSINSI